MCFSCEDKVVNVDWQVGFIGEQQIQVLDGLGQQVGIHPIFVLSSADIVDGCVATGNSGVFLERSQDLLADAEIVVVAGSFVQEVGGLDELRSEMILS